MSDDEYEDYEDRAVYLLNCTCEDEDHIHSWDEDEGCEDCDCKGHLEE